MDGFHGCYWRFDLGTGSGERIEIPRSVLRAYLGGVGLGSWLLHREAPVGVDPLAPEAPLIFAFSPLVGTPLTTSAKFVVVAKSPLTGMLCDALSSSHFAIAGKRMGVDAIVFTGRCAAPSVWVNGEVRGTELWGASVEEATDALSAEGRVACIGPAGERGVRFATISNEGRHAGRGGLGAVMGAKRLKAVVVKGSTPTSVAQREEVVRLARELSQRSLGPATAKYRELGTTANLAAFERVGALPIRNFRGGALADSKPLSAEGLAESRPHARASCASCNIGCEHRFGSGKGGGRLEYESLFALGPLCGVEDPEVVLEAARRCDTYGLDTVSTGGTLAFAMECVERGLLPAGPRFGDGASLLEHIDAIAQREGVGDLLAEGSRIAAGRIGGDAPTFAPHVKGMELPGYEPRALHTMALGFAVGTRGADHNRSGAYELDFSDEVDRLHGDARSGRRALEPEDRAALFDSLILCKFLRGVFDDVYTDSAGLLSAVTGESFTADELRSLARRVVDLRKAFNVREGWVPGDDTLPGRLLEEPLEVGPVAGARLTRGRLSEMVRSYNEARGWSPEGYPTAAATRGLLLDV
jgi:aldehyde:ferredoxin oxidoreductase